MTGLCSDHFPCSPLVSQLSDSSKLKTASGRTYSSFKHRPEWGISLRGSCVRGTWREGSFTGDSENMLREALEMEVCFHRGLVLGEHGGTLLS